MDLRAKDRAVRGVIAEDLAAAYFRLRGWEIIARNLRVGGGEIDLIARRGRWRLLIEVRYRAGSGFGDPVETVRGRKAYALGRAARCWISRNRDGGACWRMDIVTVTLEGEDGARVRHYPGAVPIEDGG